MTYPIPPQHGPHRKYWANAQEIDEPGSWPKTQVEIYRFEPPVDGRPPRSKVVYTYTRNYNMFDTFEPFRQLQDGVWHDYALISSHYTKIQVLDLETGEIVAEVVNEDVGTAFCPTGFAVFDWWDHFDESYFGENEPGPDGSDFDKKFYADLQTEYVEFSGMWGIVSGCVWGDDYTYKLRYLDLSRIREGVVTLDERFGYLELPNSKLPLRERISYSPELRRIQVPVRVDFDIDDGTAGYFWVSNLNFRDRPK